MIPFELPPYGAEWHPLYLEPIPGSGERLTIAVIAVGGDGRKQVRSVLPKSALTMLYGEHSTGIMAVIVQTLQSIQHQLDDDITPHNLSLPFGGLFFGEPRDGLAEDINGIFDQAIRLTSSLGVTAFGESKGAESEVARVFAEWSSKVRDSVLAKHATWAERFDRNVKVAGKKSARFSYLHHNYAANFGVLRPKKSADTRALKIKIFDLELLRRQQSMLLTNVEVLIGIPRESTPGITARDMQALRDSFDFIYYEGRQRDVNVVPFESASAVANHLAQVAA